MMLYIRFLQEHNSEVLQVWPRAHAVPQINSRVKLIDSDKTESYYWVVGIVWADEVTVNLQVIEVTVGQEGWENAPVIQRVESR